MFPMVLYFLTNQQTGVVQEKTLRELNEWFANPINFKHCFFPFLSIQEYPKCHHVWPTIHKRTKI